MSQEVYQAVFVAEGEAPRVTTLPYKGIVQISATEHNAAFLGNDTSVVVHESGVKVLDMPSLAVVCFENTFLRLAPREDGEELLQYPYQDLSAPRILAHSSSGIELKKFSRTLGAYFLPETDEWVIFEAPGFEFFELGRLKDSDEPIWAFSASWGNVALGFDTTASIDDLVFYGTNNSVGFLLAGASAHLLSEDRLDLEGSELADYEDLAEIATGFRDVLQKLNEKVGIRICEFAYALEESTAILIRVLDKKERLHELIVDYSGVIEQNVIQTGVKAFESREDTVALLAGGAIWVTFAENEVQKLDLAENELVTALEFGISSTDRVVVYYSSSEWESEVRSA